MIESEASDLAFEEEAIGRMDRGDLTTIDNEDAAFAILLLFLAAEAFLAGEQGITSPGGAAEKPRGIVGGGHGGEALVVNNREDILRFVDHKQRPSGEADDLGGGMGGAENSASLANAVDMSGAPLEFLLKEQIVRETGLEPLHGDPGLRLEGGGGGNDGDVFMGEQSHEVLIEGGQGFVLASLAGKLPDEGIAVLSEDGANYSLGGFQLVGAQVEAAHVGGEVVEAGEEGFAAGGKFSHISPEQNDDTRSSRRKCACVFGECRGTISDVLVPQEAHFRLSASA